MKIQIEIKSCADCPYHYQTRVFTADSFENEYDLHCKKANKQIAIYVDWNKLTSVKVPKWCPCRIKKIK